MDTCENTLYPTQQCRASHSTNSPAKRALSISAQTQISRNLRRSIASGGRNRDCSNVTGHWLKNIQIDGIRRFVIAEAIIAKSLWLILFFTSLSILIYELCKGVHDYKNSPIGTKFSIRTPESMDFPEVYICNGNPLNRSYLIRHTDALQGVKSVFESVVTTKRRKKRDIMDPDTNWLDENPALMNNLVDFLSIDQNIDFRLSDRPGYVTDSEALNQNYGSTDLPSKHPVSNDQNNILGDSFDHEQLIDFDNQLKAIQTELRTLLSRSIFVEDDNIGNFTSKQSAHIRESRSAKSKKAGDSTSPADKQRNEEGHQAEKAYNFLVEAGFSVKETFLSCYFGRGSALALNCEDIIQPVLDPNYFLCYVVKLPADIKQRKSGHGLRLLINSHISEYPSGNETEPNQVAGLYVSVSKKFDSTNWRKSVVSPGSMTKIDIDAKNVKLLNLESGPLVQPCEEDGRQLYRIFNTTYSRTACQMDCMLDAFYRYCGCILLVDKSLIKSDILEKTTFCGFNKSVSCLIPRVTKSKKAILEIDECRKKCHTPCESWRYDMRSSRGKLHTLQNGQWKIHDKSIPISDIIDLRIAYGRIEYQELVQSSSKTAAQLISDFGGQLNLWMGASLVTLVHVFTLTFGFLLLRIYTRIFGWMGTSAPKLVPFS